MKLSDIDLSDNYLLKRYMSFVRSGGVMSIVVPTDFLHAKEFQASRKLLAECGETIITYFPEHAMAALIFKKDINKNTLQVREVKNNSEKVLQTISNWNGEAVPKEDQK